MKKILQSYCAALPLLYVLLLGNALLPLDAYAQTGQVVTCGQTASTSSACTVGNLTDMFRSLMSLVISVGLPILTIFIFFRFFRAWFSLQKGDTSAYHTAVRESGHAIVGFAVVIALFGGALYTLLSYFGVKEDFLKLLKLFSAIPFDTLMAFVPHAYAQTSGQLPSPVELNIYDFLLAGMRLVMRFFIYPGLIIMWVWTGFLFVAAQGAPDAINKAKRILYWTVIMTLIFVSLHGFLVALRGTVYKIFGSQPSTQNVNYSNEGRNARPVDVNNTNYSNEGRNAPADPTNYSNEGRNSQVTPVTPTTPVESSGTSNPQ